MPPGGGSCARVRGKRGVTTPDWPAPFATTTHPPAPHHPTSVATLSPPQLRTPTCALTSFLESRHVAPFLVFVRSLSLSLSLSLSSSRCAVPPHSLSLSLARSLARSLSFSCLRRALWSCVCAHTSRHLLYPTTSQTSQPPPPRPISHHDLPYLKRTTISLMKFARTSSTRRARSHNHFVCRASRLSHTRARPF